MAIQEDLRVMVVTVGEVTATEVRSLQAEIRDVRNSATAAGSGSCPCISGKCPCKCNKDAADDARGTDPWQPG